MSLINDALRRASSAAKVSPPVGAAPMALPPPPLPPRSTAPDASPPPPPIASPWDLPPMPELDTEAPTKSNRLQIILALVLVGCVIAAVAGNFWLKKRSAEVAVARDQTGKKLVIADATERLSNSNAVALAPPRPSLNPAPAVAAPTAVSATTAPAPVIVPVVPAVPVKFPPLRLQSIFYRTENPSVIINNKTLFIHDEIQGVSVADIRSSSVTLVLSGQTNVLTLR